MPLFDRYARELTLSDVERQVLPIAQQMHSAVNSLWLTAAGQAQQSEGSVRITASVFFVSHHLLTPILASGRQAEPSVQLDLAASDASENLLFREADIAVCMYRPVQVVIVAKHTGEVPLCFCAARIHLEYAGRPTSPTELMQYDLVGFDTNEDVITAMCNKGWPVNRETFATRCYNQDCLLGTDPCWLRNRL